VGLAFPSTEGNRYRPVSPRGQFYFPEVTMYKKLIQYIREEFVARISAKTGWGKNEIVHEFEQAVSAALVRFLDEVGL
jgi:hypothetical protein